MFKEIFIRTVSVSVIFILFITSNLSAQQNNNLESQFKLGVELFQSQQYKDALPLFEKIAIQSPFNSKTTIAYLFLGKTYLQLNDLNSAKQYLQGFLEKFPTSSYKDEAHLALVKTFYSQQDYKNAFEEILTLISSSESPDYKSYAESIGETLALNYLHLYELKTYNDISTDINIKPYLQLLLGKKLEKEGDVKDAIDVYKKLINSFPESEQSAEAQKSITELSDQQSQIKSKNLIGVLLPLTDIKTGLENQSAQEILKGIKYITSEYNKKHSNKIGLIIRDTGNDSLKVNEISYELIHIPEIKAIIGPIFSNEVRQTLNDFKESGIPIISPTATDNDLVKLSDKFFQANPSFYMRAKIMAQYIYFVAGKRKMAVLNSVENYSPLLAASFINEFKDLGGEIIENKTYSSGSFDLSNPVGSIASYGEKIDGIYLPLSSKIDAAPLLSQMVQHEINVPIFGNQDWFYAKGFETSSELSNQLSFTSDYFIDYNDTSFNSLSKDFNRQTGTDIDRNVLYGYDTANYLLNLIDSGAESRESLIATMESGIEIKGYHNNIAFGKEHINRFLNIVRYSDGKFELVDRFKSGE